MKRVASLALLLLASGCATIVSASKWPVSVKSSPEGATVTVSKKDGTKIASGATPLQVTLESGEGYFGRGSYVIEATFPDGKKSTTTLTSHFNGWFIGNLVFGGLIGFLIVDPLTGAMYRFDEDATVTPSGGNLPAADAGARADAGRELAVLSLDDVPAEMRSHLVPIAP